ncbi:hypothetical protein BJ944DRAFT_238676 [Cunninghamella echinulata]|nr:hypothetical protein BJ944DRAFT_238676 [Cunninghamella echinulata]
MYGGAKLYGPNRDTVNHNPFIHYVTQSNTWNSISLPNNTYTIVNIGIDKIWMWGGLLGQDQFIYFLNVYDYKMGSWPITIPSPRPIISVDHTVTLVKDLIYIVGSGTISEGNGLQVMNFRTFTTYNTTSDEFNSFQTNGTDLNSRGYPDDGKYLIIYGGARTMNDGVFYSCEVVYYAYNIATNYLMSTSVPGHPESYTSTRFGHYLFGYRGLNVPSGSAGVLTIQDIYHPSWVPLPTANDTSSSTSISKPSGLDLQTIFPALVVPVVVTLLDPRRAFDDQYNNNDLNTEGSTAGKDYHPDSQNRDLEAKDYLMIHHHQR